MSFHRLTRIPSLQDARPSAQQDAGSVSLVSPRTREKNIQLKKINQLLEDGFWLEAYRGAARLGETGLLFRKLCAVPPGARDAAQAAVLREAARALPYFAQLPPQVVEDLTYVMHMEELPEGTVVFRQGETPRDFYVILGGIAEVLINSKAAAEQSKTRMARMRSAELDAVHNRRRSTAHRPGGPGGAPSARRPSAVGVRNSSAEAVLEAWAGAKPAPQLGDEELGVVVATLYTGEAFGESAPVKEEQERATARQGGTARTAEEEEEGGDTFREEVAPAVAAQSLRPRMASVRCQAASQLLRLNQAEYNAILHRHGIEYYHQRLMAIEECSCFSGWNLEDKKDLAKAGILKKYSPGAIIVRQGQTLDHLGIIKRGICRVVCRLPKEQLALNEVDTHLPGARLTSLLSHQRRLEEWVVDNRQVRKTIRRRVGRYDKRADADRAGSNVAGLQRQRSRGEEGFEDIVVGTLTSNQLYGELCLLDTLGISRVSIIADSVLEVLVLDYADLVACQAQHNTRFMHDLQQSYLLNNPTDEKVAHYCKERTMFNSFKAECLVHLAPRVLKGAGTGAAAAAAAAAAGGGGGPAGGRDARPASFSYRSVNSRHGTVLRQRQLEGAAAETGGASRLDTFGALRLANPALTSTARRARTAAAQGRGGAARPSSATGRRRRRAGAPPRCPPCPAAAAAGRAAGWAPPARRPTCTPGRRGGSTARWWAREVAARARGIWTAVEGVRFGVLQGGGPCRLCPGDKTTMGPCTWLWGSI